MIPIFIPNKFKSISSQKRWKLAGKIALCVFGAILIFIASIFIYFAKDIPSTTSVKTRPVIESTKIYDKTGEHLLYDIHGEEKRTIIPFEQIPDTVKYAAISLEDQDFYSHHGIKISSIVRSALKDIIKGSAAQGGSTITQQFVKKALLTDEKTLTRKIKEVILSIEIETKYSKDEILGMYLNQIPYGSSAYGIEAAAQTFFNKSAREINLPEAALLASLPNAPTYYSPFGLHVNELKARQELTLQKMADQGYITKEQADEAKGVDILSEISPKQDNIAAPHFVMYVKDYLVNKYGEQVVEQGGLKVYTTLDWDMQQAAESAIAEGTAKNIGNNAYNAALVAEDPKTGQILAMVGSKNYFGKSEPQGCVSGKNCKFEPQDNVSIRNRQPGSSFKPYVYLTAFTKGYTPETLLYDTETSFTASDSSQEDYKPKNYDGKFHGSLQMKNTLAMSLNIPAVKTLYLAGVKNSIQIAKNLGITGLNQPERYGLSLVLGGGEVKLIDHVNAYASLARGGVYKKQTFITRVHDKNGKILEEYKSSDGQRIVEEKYIGMLDYIMSTNDLRAPVFGSNNPFRFDNRPVAAKTGTTNEFRDGWAVGYTPSIAVGVWAGNNDNSPMKMGADGIIVAAPIWRNFMDKVLVNYPIEQFPKYEKEDAGKDILNGKINEQKDVKVCEIPGKDDEYCLASDACPESYVKKKDFSDAHTILYYVKKDDPRGEYPENPKDDPQFKNWEKGVKDWLKKNSKNENEPAPEEKCTENDFAEIEPEISISVSRDGYELSISAKIDSPFNVDEVRFLVDGDEIDSMKSSPYKTSYDASGKSGSTLEIKATVKDEKGKTDSVSKNISIP
ncbi:MAG TPA: PBP1A family penicillin-binding protein [Candidatus Moranbacteria bacterium]|nr:PBP1A family penicillin-binding protein [Candidatus Moranbacteria bacterium]HRZ33482.1 PBP1A family penicillin-binding protein [Candidatus Moranbacteria bacterium]